MTVVSPRALIWESVHSRTCLGVTSVANNSASRSKLVSHPMQVFIHQSGAAKPVWCSVRRVPPSIRSSRKVTVVGLPRVPPECHVSTSFRGTSIPRNSPSRTKGRPLPLPAARQRPPTRTSPVQSVVSKTPGLIHQPTISFEVSARNTRSGEAAISTLPKTDPSARSASVCARLLPVTLILSRQE